MIDIYIKWYVYKVRVYISKNLWDAMKKCLENFITLNAYIRKDWKFIIYLNIWKRTKLTEENINKRIQMKANNETKDNRGKAKLRVNF